MSQLTNKKNDLIAFTLECRGFVRLIRQIESADLLPKLPDIIFLLPEFNASAIKS